MVSSVWDCKAWILESRASERSARVLERAAKWSDTDFHWRLQALIRVFSASRSLKVFWIRSARVRVSVDAIGEGGNGKNPRY